MEEGKGFEKSFKSLGGATLRRKRLRHYILTKDGVVYRHDKKKSECRGCNKRNETSSEKTIQKSVAI